ncbi:hypothetical protein [Halovivax limisalsi]|uniref:hypothetical protein n=1 Tax=Halovivax limisalsi TaxID=1453760 RepID=UPI001FFDC85D|nr:hypothetical protein [Halovivax limisalsi]
MANTQMIRERDASEESPQEMGREAMGPAVMAAAASVGLSWYYFFGRGDKERGLFVGLWPPTILAFASYFNQRKMRRTLEKLSAPGTTIKRTIDSMMGNS